jgi:virginiamycin B lyase
MSGLGRTPRRGSRRAVLPVVLLVACAMLAGPVPAGRAASTQAAATASTTAITPGSKPLEITTGPDGNLWFTEFTGRRVGRLTPAGTVTEFGVGARPMGIAAGPDGNVWFTEPDADKLGRITADGTVTEYGIGITPGSHPTGLTAGPDGSLWFTEPDKDQIGRITSDGIVTEYVSGITTGAQPIGIAGGPDGALWFTEPNLDRIGRITADGTVTEYGTGITPGGHDFGIAAGTDGNVWFTEPDSDRVGRVEPDGTITEYTSGIAAGGHPLGIATGPDGGIWFTEPDADHIARFDLGPPPAVNAADASMPVVAATRVRGITGAPTSLGAMLYEAYGKAGQQAASVTWGDSTVGPARLTLVAPERYAISATHVYPHSGTYRITVTVSDLHNSWRTTATTDAMITPAPRADRSDEQRPAPLGEQAAPRPGRGKHRASQRHSHSKLIALPQRPDSGRRDL